MRVTRPALSGLSLPPYGIRTNCMMPTSMFNAKYSPSPTPRSLRLELDRFRLAFVEQGQPVGCDGEGFGRFQGQQEPGLLLHHALRFIAQLAGACRRADADLVAVHLVGSRVVVAARRPGHIAVFAEQGG